MIGPKAGVPAQIFTLRNSSGKDIRFSGWLLAEVSSYNPDARDDNRLATGSKRWRERAVYQTEAGNIVCHKLGRSEVAGEVDRGEILIIDAQEEFRHPAVTPREKHLAQTRFDYQVAEFFEGDALAKELINDLGIENVDVID